MQWNKEDHSAPSHSLTLFGKAWGLCAFLPTVHNIRQEQSLSKEISPTPIFSLLTTFLIIQLPAPKNVGAVISESSACSNFNKHEQNIVFPPLLIPWNGSSIFIETFPRNSAWRRHPAWKISAQTDECWQHKQLKQSYNGKCCTTFHIGGNIIQTVLALVTNTKSHKDQRLRSNSKKALSNLTFPRISETCHPQKLWSQGWTEHSLRDFLVLLACTASRSCPRVTHMMVSELVYHKTYATHSAKAV